MPSNTERTVQAKSRPEETLQYSYRRKSSLLSKALVIALFILSIVMVSLLIARCPPILQPPLLDKRGTGVPPLANRLW